MSPGAVPAPRRVPLLLPPRETTTGPYATGLAPSARLRGRGWSSPMVLAASAGPAQLALPCAAQPRFRRPENGRPPTRAPFRGAKVGVRASRDPLAGTFQVNLPREPRISLRFAEQDASREDPSRHTADSALYSTARLGSGLESRCLSGGFRRTALTVSATANRLAAPSAAHCAHGWICALPLGRARPK